MSNRSFDDKYFDSILNQVLADIEEEDIKSAEKIYHEFKGAPAFKTSLRHRWRMRKIIKSFENKDSSKKSYPIRRTIVTVAVAMAVVFSTGIFASADIFKLFQWLGFYSEEYVDISISKDYTQRIVEETASWQHGEVYVPELIPDGYELSDISTSEHGIIFSYVNSEDNYFKFSTRILGNNNVASSDNKDVQMKKSKIQGYDAIYFENRSIKILNYHTNEYFFSIESNVLGERELKKIAESTEKLSKLVVK